MNVDDKSEKDVSKKPSFFEQEVLMDPIMKRVEKSEVTDIGQRLKFTFLNLRINLNDLDQVFLPHNWKYIQSQKMDNGFVTIEDLDLIF